MTNTPEPPNLESHFATLSQLGAELNKGTDSLNHILRKVEKQLDELNLHVEAEVKLRPPIGDEKDTYFGYGQRVLNKVATWGLYLRQEDEKYAKSVFDCSRDARIWAVSYLPKLLKSIESRARKIISDIEEAKTAYLGS